MPSETISEIRSYIRTTIDGLVAGSMPPANANAINNLCRTELSTYKLQLEFARFMNKSVAVDFLQLVDKPNEPEKKLPAQLPS